MHRQIAGKLTGRVTKWLVLVFWILVVALAGPLAGKLTDVQDNQASSWLPASAESTKALDKLAPFQNQNDIPTVLVYEKSVRPDQGRPGDDRHASSTRSRSIDGAVPAKAPDGTTVPPSTLIQVSQDQQVAQGQVTFNFGKDGWNKLPDVKNQIEGIAQLPGRDGLRRRARRPGRRLGRGLLRHRRQAALLHGHRGDRDPAADLPQPDPVAAAR